MKVSQDAASLLALIPHGALMIDLKEQVIVAVNNHCKTTFGITVGAPLDALRALFVLTPLTAQMDKRITTELRAQSATMWPRFAMHTVNDGACNFDLHISYLDETRSAVYIIFAASAQGLTQIEQRDIYCETVSASAFSYPFYLNIKTKRIEFFGPIMEQFQLPEMMENFPEPVIAGGLLLKEDMEAYLQMVDRMYKGEPPSGFFRSYTPSGDILGYNVNYTVKYDKDGQPEALIGDFICKEDATQKAVPAEKANATLAEQSDGKNTVLVHQIKAHFFFNTLNTISALCKKDAGKADVAIQTFAAYMRSYMYLITEEQNIPFEQELSMVRSSLEIERMRFPDSFTYTLDLKCRDFELPPLSIQPIVENALLHGLRRTGHHGQLRIATEQIGDMIYITVEDDGRGFDTAILKESKSIGLKNMAERVKLMAGGTLSIESERGKGTCAVIAIPAQAS